MIPPTIKTSNSGPLLNSLPQELFTRFFRFLSEINALQAASTNREWRRLILSDPSIWSCLDLEDNYEWDRTHTSIDEKEAANRFIKKVVGFSKMGQDRLVDVKLEIHSFLTDPKVSLQSWNATDLSVVFNVLHFSSRFLKVLDIELVDFCSNLPDQIIHAANAIKSLDRFEALKSVTIRFDLDITLESGSAGPRVLMVTNLSTPPRYEGDELSEMSSGNGSTLAVLFREITAFTGLGIEEADLSGAMKLVMSEEALQKLEQSRKSLKVIDLNLRGLESSSERVIRFLSSCSNLADLRIICREDSIMDDAMEEVEIRIPELSKSNLKSLDINVIEDEGKARIILDDSFFRWASGGKDEDCGELEVLKIDSTPSLQKSVPTDSNSLQSFLRIQSSSLRFLKLNGIHVTGQNSLEESLHFSGLTSLVISGNVGLFELLLRCKYSCLEGLELYLPDDTEVDHSSIVEVFRSCRNTLSDITLQKGGWNYLELQSSNPEPQEDLNHQVSFSLSRLHSLSLYVEDAILSKFYVPIGYPRLPKSKLGLERTSRILPASFHLRQ